MPLIAGEGRWRLNCINAGSPYRVELVGPYRLPQVADKAGGCALSGPDGAVFCQTAEQAEHLCALANAGKLERV